MVKHATSHGLSVLVCTITASFMVELFKPQLPLFFVKIEEFGALLFGFFHVPIEYKYFDIMVVAAFLAIIWGIFFKIRFTGEKST